MQRFTEFLSTRDLRLTDQRRLIAEVFFRAGGHRSAEEITRKVKDANAAIGFATVYRTLKLLTEAGLAKGMSLGDGFSRYEPLSQRGHHDHLICRACGLIVEFENGRIESLQEEVARQHGFTVADHKLELYGLCGACRTGGS
jgi:Fur family ferric uptake transcriptional regulator